MDVNRETSALRGQGAPIRTAGGLAAAKMPPSDRQRMENAGQNTGRFIQKTPSCAEMVPGRPETMTAHNLSLADNLNLISRSVGGLTALAEFTEHINHYGKRSPERHFHMAAMMMPFALWMVNQRHLALQKKGSGPGASPAEMRLLRTYAASHGEGWTLPEWSWYAHPFVEYASHMANLPGPGTYLNQLSKPLPEAVQLLSDIETAQERLADAKRKADEFLRGREPNKAGADAQDKEAESQRKKIDQCEKRLDELLFARSDIDPTLIEECCSEVQVSAALKPEIAQALVRVEENLGKLLKAMLLVPPKGAPPAAPLELDWPELIVTDEGSRVALIKSSADAVKEGGSDPAIQKEILNLFCKVRQALVNAADAYPPSKTRNDTRSAIENRLQTLFPVDPASERQMLAILVQQRDPEIKAAVSQLFTSKIKTPVAGVANTFSSTTLLEQPANLESLGWAVQIMLTGDEQMAEGIRRALQQTALQPVVDFTSSLQKALISGDSALLANTLNDEIKKQRESSGSAQLAPHQGQSTFGKLAALILSAKVLAEHPLYKSCLKEQVRDLDGLSELARTLTTQLSGKNKASAEFVEKCRSTIEAGFSTTLDDYWGHQSLVRRLHKKLEQHLALLEKRALWGLLPASYVIPNGYLLYGPPGTGKTFLATCIANTLKIPLLIVSNDEMLKTLTHVRSEIEETSGSKTLKNMAEERLEKALTRFLDQKVAQAETLMRKNGARSIVLFFDEIEGWLLRRTLVLSSPEQVNLTDNMLRLFESYVKKHPEIIFMAATNHYELLDDAATRLGRFGHFLEIDRTTIEDAKDILEKGLKALQVALDLNAAGAGFENLARDAAGMNPLAIKQAVFNRYALKLIESADGKAQLTLEDLVEAIKDMKEWTTPPPENGKANGKGNGNGKTTAPLAA